MTGVDRKLFVPIEKIDDEQHMVTGRASTPSMDSQGERITSDAIRNALPGYMKFANVREMHQLSAVGKTLSAVVDDTGLHIGAKIVDDDAWKKVKAGVYNGFSIGGKVTEKVDNEIRGLNLVEISLVDRPANPECTFDVWKAEVDPPITPPPNPEPPTPEPTPLPPSPKEAAVDDYDVRKASLRYINDYCEKERA